MAKQVYLAKKCFDDGTKRGDDNKAHDYHKGEVYQGSGNDLENAKKLGLVCTKKEFDVKDEIIDEKGKEIGLLQKRIKELEEALEASEKKVFELQAELDSLEVIED